MIDHETKVTMAKMAVGGGGVIIYSLTLSEWVAAITIIYLALQIGLLLHKYFANYQRWRKQRRRRRIFSSQKRGT